MFIVEFMASTIADYRYFKEYLDLVAALNILATENIENGYRFNL